MASICRSRLCVLTEEEAHFWVNHFFESTVRLLGLVLILLQSLINMASREILLKQVRSCHPSLFNGFFTGKAKSSKCLHSPRNLGLCFLSDCFLLLSTLLPLFSTHWHPFCSLDTPNPLLPHCPSIWLFPMLVLFTSQICTLLLLTTLSSLLNFIFPRKPSLITYFQIAASSYQLTISISLPCLLFFSSTYLIY